jgi:hypothetical protein
MNSDISRMPITMAGMARAATRNSAESLLRSHIVIHDVKAI